MFKLNHISSFLESISASKMRNTSSSLFINFCFNVDLPTRLIQIFNWIIAKPISTCAGIGREALKLPFVRLLGCPIYDAS